MTKVYESENAKDNEQRSFKADQNGDAARNICGPQLTDIVDAINDKDKITKSSPVIYNVDCAFANTEYSQALNANTSGFTIRTRDSRPLRVSYTSGSTGDFNLVAQNLFDNSFLYFGTTSVWRGQNFKALSISPITLAKVKLFKVNTPSGTLVMEIRDANGAVPGNTVLATSNPVDITTLSTNTNGEVVGFTFPTPFTPVLNSNYSFVISPANMVSGLNEVAIRQDTLNSYLDGSSSFSSNGGVNWSANGSINLYFDISTNGGNYINLKSNAVYSEDNLNATGLVLYFQSSVANTLVEILEWT